MKACTYKAHSLSVASPSTFDPASHLGETVLTETLFELNMVVCGCAGMLIMTLKSFMFGFPSK